MLHDEHHKVFRKGSTTYYFSSLFFPKPIREDVYILYGFVRVADNLVDEQPVDPQRFIDFSTRYRHAWEVGEPCGDRIIDTFIELQRRKKFDPAWTEAFLDSMRHDLDHKPCRTVDDTLAYIYGSAEVIGLFMAKIMDLPDEALPQAAMLGRAMQYINFIRDIDEDNRLGRRYLPLGDSPLGGLLLSDAERDPAAFHAFIRKEIERYRMWQRIAATGYRFIPWRCRIPIMTAADMYCWTAKIIASDPMVVFRRKVKPTKRRIILCGLSHMLGLCRGCS